MSTVADVLRTKGRKVVTVTPDVSVYDAACRMAHNKIGAVIVVDDDMLLGIFTERDLMNRIVAQDCDPRSVAVRDVMTETVACGTLATTLEECRTAMTRNRVRHLPIVEDGRLVGIISSGDILAREIDEQQETIHYLHEYIGGRA